MKIYTVKEARKDYPDDNIKKGNLYYYCEPKNLRKTKDRKKRSKSKDQLQLWINNYAKSHMGEFASNMEDWRERFENIFSEEERDELVSEIEEYISTKEDNKSNMPDSLQEGHMINEQIDELNDFLSEVQEWEEE